jgi:hypothetical protein
VEDLLPVEHRQRVASETGQCAFRSAADYELVISPGDVSSGLAAPLVSGTLDGSMHEVSTRKAYFGVRWVGLNGGIEGVHCGLRVTPCQRGASLIKVTRGVGGTR